MKSGFVCLIGRPNVGKSTLLNNILKRKITITSSKPQTTRNAILGIYNDEESQIAFVDTPGIHKPNHELGKILNKGAYQSIEDVDVVCLLVDELGKGDKYIISKLEKINKPVILVINKIDGLSKEEIFKKIIQYKDLYPFADIVPLSALKGRNVQEFICVLKKYLPDEVQYFDKKEITNRSDEFMICEFIREKVFRLTKQEIPYTTTCIVEKINKHSDKWIINACIVVSRDATKKIIIGKNGSMIKKIGIMARKDIENYLNKKIYLELYVKTIKKWQEREEFLNQFGYNENME